MRVIYATRDDSVFVIFTEQAAILRGQELLRKDNWKKPVSGKNVQIGDCDEA